MALRRTDDGYQDPLAWMKGDSAADGGSMFPDIPPPPSVEAAPSSTQTTGTPKGTEDRTTDNVPPPAPPAPPVPAPTVPTPPPAPGPAPSPPAAGAPPTSGYSYISDNGGDPLYRGTDGKTYHYVKGPSGTYVPEVWTGANPAMNQRDIAAHVRDFGLLHPNANPSVTKDPNYWVTQMLKTSPNGAVDWGYWEDRMMRPEGPPEGPAGPPKATTPPPRPGGYQAPPPSPYSGNPNQVAVGTDPLSQGTDKALLALLQQGGRLTSPVGQKAYEALNSYLSGGSLNNRLESIREKMALGERATLADARGQLADRGLLSEGSTAQGPEMSTIGRVAQHAGETFANESRQALVEDDANLMGAIQTATGLDEAAANRLLATVGSVGDRQKMLSDVAARSLEDNMAWNQFLAQYGLDRDKAMYEIQSGQSAQMLPLINAFVSWINSTSGGYV